MKEITSASYWTMHISKICSLDDKLNALIFEEEKAKLLQIIKD